MSAERLRALGERLHGARWQAAMARDLGVSDRRLRQWLSGDPIPPGIWRDLERIEAGRGRWPTDEWIVGTDAEGLREYIIHTRAPRFVARVAIDGDGSVDLISGVTYACRAGELICEVAWMDTPPTSEPEVLDLFQRAEAVIDTYTAGKAIAAMSAINAA